MRGRRDGRGLVAAPEGLRDLAGVRGDAPSNISDQAPLVWRAPEGPEGTGGLRGAAPNEVRPSPRGRPGPPAPGTPVGPQATPPKRKAYSPRNALIAGISRTACTRPAR